MENMIMEDIMNYNDTESVRTVMVHQSMIIFLFSPKWYISIVH